MLINKVSAGRGAAWINESIIALKMGGKAIWIPALIIGLLGAIPFVSAIQGVLMLFFYGSLVLCINNPGQQNNIFSGFQNGNFNRILPILILNIAFAGLIIIALLPEIKVLINLSMQGQSLNEVQALEFIKGVLKHMTWILPLGTLLHWITLFAIPLASVAEQSGTTAITLALQATFSNLPALIVNLLCLIMLSILIIFMCIIPIGIFSLVFASTPQLLNVVSIPFTAVMTAIIIALMSANMLHAYRDIFGAVEVATTKDTEVML